METFALYILKSIIWLSGFALVYILFLRNERFFLLNRFYLITGIIISFLFPLISVNYIVMLPEALNNQETDNIISGIQVMDNDSSNYFRWILLGIYLSGVIFVISGIIGKSRSVLKVIKKAEIISSFPVKLIKTVEYTNSFSFFSYVFINPSITDTEKREIVNHELVHVRQWHWLDLVLAELLCIIQWFNPVVYIYSRLIRQNHEYLADKVALQLTSDPAIYKATLLNQIVGSPVVSLANSFNYSLNKKRFNMMKNITTSPYRKLKIFLILPVFAIILYSFAKPEYRYTPVDEYSGNIGAGTMLKAKEVKGKVVQQDGKPLSGAALIVTGTSTGVLTDATGHFRFDNVPEDAVIAVSASGFISKVFKPDFKDEMIIELMRDPDYKEGDYTNIPPPPPPPPPSVNLNIKGYDVDNPPLFVIDGVISDNEESKVDPEAILSINILKEKYATDKYGEKGKDGVIEITTIKNDLPDSGNKVSDVKVIGYSKNQKSDTSAMHKKLSIRSNSLSTSGADPLIVLDGKITDIDIDKMDPETIESIVVYKDDSAVEKYGEKGKDGVIEIKSKMNISGEMGNEITYVEVKRETPAQEASKTPFVIVEEMPEFPGGGTEAMRRWISQKLQYPVKAKEQKIEGRVIIRFLVNKKGKLENIIAMRSDNHLLDAEAIRVVSIMPDWKPGKQGGKEVDVYFQIPIDFRLQ